MHSKCTQVLFLATCLLLAGQAQAISQSKLDSWVTKFESFELDWETPFDDRKNLQPLTVPVSGNSVTLLMETNKNLFGSTIAGGINDDLLKGKIQGQEDDPDSYASLTVWPTGLNGRFAFEDPSGERQLIHIDKLDGTKLTVLYNDKDIINDTPPDGATARRRKRDLSNLDAPSRERLWKRQAATSPAAGKDCGVGVVADVSFTTKFGNDSIKQMASIMNDIQNIYLRSFDVGVPIDLIVLDTADKVGLGPNGIAADGNITLALDQLAASTKNPDVVPAGRQLCAVHMFTARRFGSTLGLAFVGNPTPGSDGGICTGSFATGVSTGLGNDGGELPQAAWVTTVAHELGHTFGSGHDEDIGCANQKNIMGAIVDISGAVVNTFSTCTLGDIAAVLETKSGCLRARK